MKKIHYQNVGFPRTGTTWLWRSLIDNPAVFKVDNFSLRLKTRKFALDNKENSWQEDNVEKLIDDPSEYINIYSKYDVSMNFRPFTFMISDAAIEKIAEYTTHASIIIRNPYEVLDSFYNMQHLFQDDLDKNIVQTTSLGDEWKAYKLLYPEVSGSNQSDVLNFYIYRFSFANTVRRWLNFKNKFKVFYYEDLVHNPNAFYNSVCEFIGIPFNSPIPEIVNDSEGLNKIHNKSNLTHFLFYPDHILTVNREIDQLSEILGKDFSHWKR